MGVLDSGIDPSHPDLAANVWRNPGGIGTCPAGSFGVDIVNLDCDPYDDHGHGTHVAGTIGAVGNDGLGVTGVAATLSDSVAALDWAVEAKRSGVNIRVVNASLGGAEASAGAVSDRVLALFDAFDHTCSAGFPASWEKS